MPTSFVTTRDIPATPAAVFAAMTTPARLARWWGPAGFSNTFHVCDVRPAGQWSFVMHGPDGRDYTNENRFEVVEPEARLVIRHDCEPLFRLTLELAPVAGGTRLTWTQAFDDAEVARRVEAICVPANEQNLDRLTAEVLQAG